MRKCFDQRCHNSQWGRAMNSFVKLEPETTKCNHKDYALGITMLQQQKSYLSRHLRYKGNHYAVLRGEVRVYLEKFGEDSLDGLKLLLKTC